jgi:magnesium chelatase family protein
MSFQEMIQTSKIYSISGKLGKKHLIEHRPFRAPHHTISSAGLVGGGSIPQPGDISMAHNGILFLDELTEFKRTTLELLRQPLENKEVGISRAQQAVIFPSSFLLIAALNPCPCGYLGDTKRTCSCSQHQIQKYLEKVSGPLLDRIDLQINVQSITYDTLQQKNDHAQSSAELYQGVQRALELQEQRFGQAGIYNNTMNPDQIERWCTLTPAAQELVKKAFDKLKLSMRGYHKLLKVARTIADIEKVEQIDVRQAQEAIMYRSLDQYLETLKG